MNIFLGILLACILIYLFIGYYFYRTAFFPKVFPYEKTYEIEIENGRFEESFFNTLPKEEVSISSEFGYHLNGIYFPVENSNRTVVLVHGITYSLWGSIKYLPLFYKRGFNVLVYDHRNHGKSGGRNCTFGFLEKQDLKTVVSFAFSKLGNDGIVGTMGESLGAATVLQHAAIDNRISFVVADCGYSDLTEQFAYRLKSDYHLPPFVLKSADLFCRLFNNGLTFDQISPLKDIKNVKTPIFFIHGQDDDYVPTYMSKKMYNAKEIGMKKIFLADNAAHAQSLNQNPETYDQQLGDFLGSINLN
jgi:fermentation-respiration switch protein FrsA (DUF1100 family)